MMQVNQVTQFTTSVISFMNSYHFFQRCESIETVKIVLSKIPPSRDDYSQFSQY